jgi:hypothetical protein
MADILVCGTEGDASVTQHLDERAEIAVPLAQRPAGAHDGGTVLPVGAIEGDFGRRSYVNGRTAEISAREGGPRVPRDQVLKRRLPLLSGLAEEIDKHIVDQGTTEDGYLFQGCRHKHVTRRTYYEDFDRAAGKAGLPPEFIPHTLRRCFASVALAHGIPITEASRWLGHKSIEVTHQIYGHLVPTSWDRARTVLDDAARPGGSSHPTRKLRAELWQNVQSGRPIPLRARLHPAPTCACSVR